MIRNAFTIECLVNQNQLFLLHFFRFYMPHGITVDGDGHVWATDVALHQVFKITNERVAMILGTNETATKPVHNA